MLNSHKEILGLGLQNCQKIMQVFGHLQIKTAHLQNLQNHMYLYYILSGYKSLISDKEKVLLANKIKFSLHTSQVAH